jgi:hypothetical protein
MFIAIHIVGGRPSFTTIYETNHLDISKYYNLIVGYT